MVGDEVGDGVGGIVGAGVGDSVGDGLLAHLLATWWNRVAAGSTEVVTKMTPAEPLDTPKPGLTGKPQLGAHATCPSSLEGGGGAKVGKLVGPPGTAPWPTQPAVTVSLLFSVP